MPPRKTTAKNSPKGKEPAKKRRPFLFLMKWMVILGIWGGIALLGLLFYYAHDLPSVTKAASFERKRSITIIASDNETVLARYGDLMGQNVSYEDLPDDLILAVTAIEDRRFFSHFGVDPIGIARAFYTNLKSKRIAQGGSTISQQLAKNLFLSPKRTLKRKIQEAILAIWLEQKYTKEEILSAYLNRVYLGSGAYGVDAASEIYFGKSVEELTREESAILAGALKAPSRYNPISSPKRAHERMLVVLQAMEYMEHNNSKKKQSESAPYTVIKPVKKPYNIVTRTDKGRYFADWIVDTLPGYIGNSNEDLIVYTTLSPRIQKNAQKIADFYIKERAKTKDEEPLEYAAVIAEKDGAIRALLGGSDYNKTQFNRATQAMRQPGSSFKPFVYLSALEQGWSIHDTINDDEFEKNGYSPKNHTGEYHGDVPLWHALSQSYNIASVRLLDETGIAATMKIARKLGITAEIQPDLSIALGTSEVPLIEMVGAYHILANYGNNIPLYGIRKITLANGTPLYDKAKETLKEPENVGISPHSINQLTLMMEDVVQQGTGQRAKLGFPAAGKTGTSQESRDAWFLGFTSHYTAGVWVGYDQNKPTNNVYGGTIPAAIWHDMVLYAHRGQPGDSLSSDAPIDGSFQAFLSRLTSSEKRMVDYSEYVKQKEKGLIKAERPKRRYPRNNNNGFLR